MRRLLIETAHKEPSHLDFHCLQMYVRIYLMSAVTRLYPIFSRIFADAKFREINHGKVTLAKAFQQRYKRKHKLLIRFISLIGLTQVQPRYTLLKIFKGTPDNFSIGDNANPCPKDKAYISLDNKVETQFLSLSL